MSSDSKLSWKKKTPKQTELWSPCIVFRSYHTMPLHAEKKKPIIETHIFQAVIFQITMCLHEDHSKWLTYEIIKNKKLEVNVLRKTLKSTTLSTAWREHQIWQESLLKKHQSHHRGCSVTLEHLQFSLTKGQSQMKNVL